jgi:hypothetical protein
MTSDDTQRVASPADPVAQPFQPVAPGPGPFEVPPQPVTPVIPAKKRSAVSWINVALGLALVVAIGGVAFAAGRMTAPATAAGAGGPNGLRNGQDGRTFNGYFPGGGAAGQGGGPRVFGDGGGAAIQGTVTAVTATSITIKTASGQEITVALDPTTTYHQQTSATASDVTTGGTVIVRLGFNRTGGPSASSGPSGPTATDITVVPN